MNVNYQKSTASSDFIESDALGDGEVVSSKKREHDLILILDFGSQYTQLIARRLRESNIYCEVLPYNASTETILGKRPKGLILSGSASSVYDKDAPQLEKGLIKNLNCPLLGICYGLQSLALSLGGKVEAAQSREYGLASLKTDVSDSLLFKDLPAEMDVWMSHGDHVVALPEGFRLTASTNQSLNAFEDLSNRIYGVQFHPEVAHTIDGGQLLYNFAVGICAAVPDWSAPSIISEQTERISEQIGQASALCALSGGVDSTVAAVLVQRAIGDRQTCIFVDTGLLREGEFERTLKAYESQLKLKVRGVRAADRFLRALEGVTDPEEKRRRIGHLFIEIFEEEAARIGEVDFLVQGTLYPDVIESVAIGAQKIVIKSHHNVGGLPERMRLKLVEPLRELFKDEVRRVGAELNIPDEILMRHPFPGPGLAVRILGEVSDAHLKLLRTADKIFEEELKSAGWYGQVWQAFPVLLPISSVGVMGDARTYERCIALRAVTSTDGMTADWVRLPHELLGRVASRIISEVRGVNRVVYDISSKPPSTIEWE